MTEGVDYAFERPDPQGLANVGKRFAVRYVGPGSLSKHLTPDEVSALTAAGLSIVAVAEGVDVGLMGGYGVGVDWAVRASNHASSLGMPESRPVYLAVDFDCTEAQWASVKDALDGAADAIGRHRVGVYGGFNTIEWAARDDAARWFWQTYAWSDGQWSEHAHIQQYRNGVSLVGGTVDLDRAMTVDYGQWNPGVAPASEGDEVKYLRESNGDIWREEGTNPANGQPILWPVHNPEAWAAYEASGASFHQVESIDWRFYTNGEGLGNPVGAAVESVKSAIEHILSTPMIDAVAVASAIAARPEIARTVAEAVARQLATISGSITLSGEMRAGITPPQG